MSLIKTRTTLEDFNNHFENDFNKYKKRYVDCSKKQFISELENHYKHCLKNVRIISIPELGLFEVDNEANHYGIYILPEIQDLYKNENGINELKRKNLEITFDNIIDQLKIKKSEISSDYINVELLDLSSSKATQKIIYLKELGLLDYLLNKEPFNLSTNSLANVLSAITGEKPETLQSYLNPITNPNSGQKNNPLNNDKNVKSIKQTLINLGFKPPY